MKVSGHAARNHGGYRAAWNRFKLGQIEGAYKDASGHVVVPDPVVGNLKSAAVYARVSTRKQKDDLQRQSERMVAFDNAAGLSVVTIVTEVATGVNDNRPKPAKLLKDGSWGTLAAGHQDHLSRAGFGWFEVLLEIQGRRIIVANAAQEHTISLCGDFLSLIHSFAARLYGLRSARRRTNQVAEALGLSPEKTARALR